MQDVFFDSWSDLGRVIVVGTAAYVALFALLRISGKRTLAKLNAFDLVVTVALGSTLASVLLDRSVSLAEGLMALLLLVALQFAVAWTSVRSRRFDALVKSEPTLLLHHGTFLEAAMRAQRVTRDEVVAALRASGAGDPTAVDGVILETDGTLSVVRDVPATGGSLPGSSGTARTLDTDAPSRS